MIEASLPQGGCERSLEKYFDEEGLNESEDTRKIWISFLAHFVNKNHCEQRLDKQTDCQVRQ